MEMSGDHCKNLGILKDSCTKKNMYSPFTLSLFDKNSGEKVNLKLKRVIKPEETPEDPVNSTKAENRLKVKDHIIINPQNKQPSIKVAEILNNNYHAVKQNRNVYKVKTTVNKNNIESKHSHLSDYESVLLKIIADLMADAGVDLVKKNSGFCILNGLVLKSNIDVKDEKIIVINSKLAKEGGIALDIPAEMLLDDPNWKTCGPKSEVIVKPFTLVVGESIIQIRICNKLPANRDNSADPGVQANVDLKQRHKTTQTETSFQDSAGYASSGDRPEQVQRNEVFISLTEPKVKNRTENARKQNAIPPEIETKAHSAIIINDKCLIKKPKSEVKYYKQTNLNVSLKRKRKMKSKNGTNHSQNNVKNKKYIKRLHNVTNRIANKNSKIQLKEMCGKLTKLCKSLQIRHKVKQRTLQIENELRFKSVCCTSHVSKFTIKKETIKSTTVDSCMNSFTIANMQKTNNMIDVNNTNFINKENILEGRLGKESICDQIFPLQGDSLTYDGTRIQQNTALVNNEACLCKDAETMTEITDFRIDRHQSSKELIRHKKTAVHRRVKGKKTRNRYCGHKKYHTKEINKLKNKLQVYESLLKNNVKKYQRRGKVVKKPSTHVWLNNDAFKYEKQSTTSNTVSSKSNTSWKGSTVLTRSLLSEPTDNAEDTLILYDKCSKKGTPDYQFQNTATHVKYSSDCNSRVIFENSETSSDRMNNVKVGCERCGKMCELRVCNVRGKLELQLKSHVCLVKADQKKKNENCSQNIEHTKVYSIFPPNSRLSQSSNTETSVTNTTHIRPSVKTAIRNKLKENNSSCTSKMYSISSHDEIDNENSLTEVFVNSNTGNTSTQSVDMLDHTHNSIVTSEECLDIECEDCGKSRTLTITKRGGQTVLELKNHICLVRQNERGELEKLTERMILLNDSDLSLLEKKCFKNADSLFLKEVNHFENANNNNNNITLGNKQREHNDSEEHKTNKIDKSNENHNVSNNSSKVFTKKDETYVSKDIMDRIKCFVKANYKGNKTNDSESVVNEIYTKNIVTSVENNKHKDHEPNCGNKTKRSNQCESLRRESTKTKTIKSIFLQKPRLVCDQNNFNESNPPVLHGVRNELKLHSDEMSKITQKKICLQKSSSESVCVMNPRREDGHRNVQFFSDTGNVESIRAQVKCFKANWVQSERSSFIQLGLVHNSKEINVEAEKEGGENKLKDEKKKKKDGSKHKKCVIM